MTTTARITSALIGRAHERSMSLGFAYVESPVMHPHVAAVPSVHLSARTATDATATATTNQVMTVPHASVTNLWLGGFQGEGFSSGASGTKRIHPGRLEGMT